MKLDMSGSAFTKKEWRAAATIGVCCPESGNSFLPQVRGKVERCPYEAACSVMPDFNRFKRLDNELETEIWWTGFNRTGATKTYHEFITELGFSSIDSYNFTMRINPSLIRKRILRRAKAIGAI